MTVNRTAESNLHQPKESVGAPLASRRIVVPESRQLDLFSTMLERHGANVLRCPLVKICALHDMSQLDEWIGRLVGRGHDVLAFYTGDGISYILERADQLGLGAEALAAFARAEKISRGPKPAAALRKLGLRADRVTTKPTTEGLLTLLAECGVEDRMVGVQIYPGCPSQRLTASLQKLGAAFDPVLPYEYAPDEQNEEVAQLIQEMAAGRIDLIAFTSQLQVHRLQEVAEQTSLQRELVQAFGRTPIAAIGPITADAVAKAGGWVAVAPAPNFHLKPFVAKIVDALC